MSRCQKIFCTHSKRWWKLKQNLGLSQFSPVRLTTQCVYNVGPTVLSVNCLESIGIVFRKRLLLLSATQLDHADYHVDKTVSAAAAAVGSSTDVTVDVTYEPSCIGESRTQLLLSSSAGGDYTFPLTGVCLPPKPQVLSVCCRTTVVLCIASYSCTIIGAAHRFSLPDFASSHWFTHCDFFLCHCLVSSCMCMHVVLL